MNSNDHLGRFYSILHQLESKTGIRYLLECSANMDWPRQGVYFFFEEGELREDGAEPRPERYKSFQFSILNVLPNSALQEQVIQLESTIKLKLGSRAFGLNSN